MNRAFVFAMSSDGNIVAIGAELFVSTTVLHLRLETLSH